MYLPRLWLRGLEPGNSRAEVFQLGVGKLGKFFVYQGHLDQLNRFAESAMAEDRLELARQEKCLDSSLTNEPN
jgi:hypothetical protein